MATKTCPRIWCHKGGSMASPSSPILAYSSICSHLPGRELMNFAWLLPWRRVPLPLIHYSMVGHRLPHRRQMPLPSPFPTTTAAGAGRGGPRASEWPPPPSFGNTISAIHPFHLGPAAAVAPNNSLEALHCWPTASTVPAAPKLWPSL